MSAYAEAIRAAVPFRRIGQVTRVTPLALEAHGPDALLGEVCEVHLGADVPPRLAEVVSAQSGRIVLMPYGSMQGVSMGARVVATGEAPCMPVGPGLLGRVVDAFGHPLDGAGTIDAPARYPLHPGPRNPLTRAPIDHQLGTGIRVLDTLLPLGYGQRMGIFAGSGVGKSSLLGMLARNVKADVSVVCMLGERGREVKEFLQRGLDEDAMARTVVLAATSDQPAVVRARAAYAATAIAEYFRDQGARVFLMMDSITRFAMARREIDLATGQPPTARGYTPSVFTEIPALCERCGALGSGGSITAIYTVLVEGDDHNEPIADTLRATLDGHIVLTRELAHQGHFPAVDVLQSISRLEGQLLAPEMRAMQSRLRSLMATHAKHREMVDMGLYKAGANAALDEALERMPKVQAFLRQGLVEHCSLEQAGDQLRALVGKGGRK
jgi:flagellum-specific ATP synthase